MKTKLLLITILFFISCNSHSPKPTNELFDKGTLQGNVFSNKYFGFTLTIDTAWHIQNQSELTNLVQERSERLNKNLSIAKGADILLSLNIDSIDNMPQVLISSLDLTMFPKIKSERDYLNEYSKKTKKLYENYAVQIDASEIGEERIGNKTFFTALITIKADNFLAYQKRYSLKIKDRLLNMMANYNSVDQSKRCQDLISSIKWTE